MQKHNLILSLKKIYIKEGGIIMKNNIVKEIIKDLNWRERIVVVLLKKIFLKVYKSGITFGFNNK